jgi:hypothetical protein
MNYINKTKTKDISGVLHPYVILEDDNGSPISATNPLAVNAVVSVDSMSLEAEMKVDSGHDLYEATTVTRTGDLAVSFDLVTGLTLAKVQSVENKTKGWVYSTKGATVTTTAITLVAGNQKTGYPVIAVADEIEVIYRGDSRFSAVAGTVTANAGTDLNTSALALETGGNLDTLAGAVSGTEMQVDIVGALPAGTNAIGKLSANSGVDIGDVDVTSLPAVTGAVTANPTKLPISDDADFVKKYYTNAGAVTDGIIWSPAAGKRWHITDIILNVSAASVVTIEDDLAAGDSPVMKFELGANGGMVSNFKTPLFSGEDEADLLITSTAGNVYCTVVGYEV